MLAFLRDMMGQWLRQTREMNYLLFNELILLIDQTTFSMTDHIRTVYLTLLSIHLSVIMVYTHIRS